jgi:TonB family protein
MTRVFFLVLTLIATMPVAARGQTILGLVREKGTGQPLRLIEVQLVPDTGAAAPIIARTTTDSSGTFFIDAPALGTYRLAFHTADATLLSAPVVVQSSEVQHEFQLDLEGTKTYFEFQVEKPVRPLPGQPAPRFPQSLLTAGIEGEVLAQFVVDTTGRADMATFKTLRSTRPEFAYEVRQVVAQTEFAPATIGGRKVKQVVHLPFDFCINGPPPTELRHRDPPEFFPQRVRPSACMKRGGP